MAKTMKVKVSKVMADFINKAAEELGFKAHASVETFTERGYKMQVDVMMDPWELERLGDYDYRRDEYKAIRVDYPDDYYACPQYLTTKGLLKEFRRRRVENEQELKQMLRDMCEI